MVVTFCICLTQSAPTPTSEASVCKMKGREKSGFIITGVDSKISLSLLKALVHCGVQVSSSGSVFLVMLVSGTAMVA